MWVGGVGWSQTFINHCFMIYLTIILGPKNCANPKSQISQNLWDGQVCSQVWANMRALEFFYWTHISSWIQFFYVWLWWRRSEFKLKKYRNSSVHKRVKTMHCNETVSSLNTKGNDEINGCNGLGTPGHQLVHDLIVSPLFLLQPQHFWCREFQIYLLTIEFTWRQVRTGKV